MPTTAPFNPLTFEARLPNRSLGRGAGLVEGPTLGTQLLDESALLGEQSLELAEPATVHGLQLAQLRDVGGHPLD